MRLPAKLLAKEGAHTIYVVASECLKESESLVVLRALSWHHPLSNYRQLANAEAIKEIECRIVNFGVATPKRYAWINLIDCGDDWVDFDLLPVPYHWTSLHRDALSHLRLALLEQYIGPLTPELVELLKSSDPTKFSKASDPTKASDPSKVQSDQRSVVGSSGDNPCSGSGDRLTDSENKPDLGDAEGGDEKHGAGERIPNTRTVSSDRVSESESTAAESSDEKVGADFVEFKAKIPLPIRAGAKNSRMVLCGRKGDPRPLFGYEGHSEKRRFHLGSLYRLGRLMIRSDDGAKPLDEEILDRAEAVLRTRQPFFTWVHHHQALSEGVQEYLLGLSNALDKNSSNPESYGYPGHISKLYAPLSPSDWVPQSSAESAAATNHATHNHPLSLEALRSEEEALRLEEEVFRLEEEVLRLVADERSEPSDEWDQLVLSRNEELGRKILSCVERDGSHPSALIRLLARRFMLRARFARLLSDISIIIKLPRDPKEQPTVSIIDLDMKADDKFERWHKQFIELCGSSSQ